jgi:O-acetylhomoserine/O-acetylserine sulfhydrylase-like pyridoxal-dependent enzyme
MKNPSNKELRGMPINLPEATSPGGYQLTPVRAFRDIPRLRCVPMWSVIQFATAQLVKVDLARKYLRKGVGGVFTFGLKSGYVAGNRPAGSVQLFSNAASTRHRRLSNEQRLAPGASVDAIRLSIGVESSDYLMRDLDESLAASRQ